MCATAATSEFRRASASARFMSKRRCTAFDTLLTFWPPAPCARTAVSSTSDSGTTIGELSPGCRNRLSAWILENRPRGARRGEADEEQCALHGVLQMKRAGTGPLFFAQRRNGLVGLLRLVGLGRARAAGGAGGRGVGLLRCAGRGARGGRWRARAASGGRAARVLVGLGRRAGARLVLLARLGRLVLLLLVLRLGLRVNVGRGRSARAGRGRRARVSLGSARGRAGAGRRAAGRGGRAA